MYTRPEDFNEAIVRCINHQQKGYFFLILI